MDFQNIDNYSQEELEEILDDASNSYYNTNKLTLKDDEFDFVKEYLLSKYPHSKYKTKIGHVTGNKVKLPYYMGSMDNLKKENKINNWMKKYKEDYVIMSKLDGISGLLYKNGHILKLFTRGNGVEGKDVSHLIKYFNIPNLSAHSEITIRGEILVKQKVYDKLKTDSANSRSFASGLVNSKKPDKNVKYLDFVAYEMLYPEFKISEQLKKLKKMGFNVVKNHSIKNIDFKYLQTTLKSYKSSEDYLIDGIIIRHNDNYGYNKSGNPDYAFAFKMLLTEQIEETIVVKVHWNVSKYRKLFPQVQVRKVNIGGVNIEYVSGKSGQFIYKNKIGPGAIIKIARSCDVIPDILEVVLKAKKPDMPDSEYEWNETGVDIFSIDNNDNNTCKIKLITDFFKNINVSSMGPGIIKKLYENGYTEIVDILHIKKKNLLEIEGFQETLANKIINNIKIALENVNLIEIMNASNIFGNGLGEIKLALIFSNIPDVMKHEIDKNLKEKIMSIDGFSDITSNQFVNNLGKFKLFLKSLKIKTHNLDSYIEKTQIKKNIVFTGFRNSDLEQYLETHKIAVKNTINSDTFLLITKDKLCKSSKIQEAQKKKIKILTLKEFLKNKSNYIK
jgi:DNA ligase (NAD+)